MYTCNWGRESTFLENDGCVTLRYVLEENADKWNPIKKALWVVDKIPRKNQSIFALPSLTSAFTFPLSVKSNIQPSVMMYLIAVLSRPSKKVWRLGYASIPDHTIHDRKKIQVIWWTYEQWKSDVKVGWQVLSDQGNSWNIIYELNKTSIWKHEVNIKVLHYSYLLMFEVNAM